MKKRTKVIELTNEFSFGNGRAMVINELSKKLQKYYDIEIWYSHYSNKLPETKIKLVKVMPKEIFNRLMKEKNVIVHSHFGKNQIFACLARKKNKTMMHVITDYVNPPRKISGASFLNNLKVEQFNKLIYNFGNDAVVGISKYSLETLKDKYKVNKKKVFFIPCGIDTKKYSPLAKHKKGKKEVLIGCFSRFSRSKNIHSLIKISDHLPENVKLMLAGAIDTVNPGYYHYCRKLAKKKGREIIFLTDLNEKDKIDFINSLDIFVYPSLWEGFGLPIIEAMACKKPVICLKRFAMPELVKNNFNGFVVKDEKEFLERIKELCMDKTMRDKFGDNSFKTSKEYDWGIIAERYRKLFETLKTLKKENVQKN